MFFVSVRVRARMYVCVHVLENIKFVTLLSFVSLFLLLFVVLSVCSLWQMGDNDGVAKHQQPLKLRNRDNDTVMMENNSKCLISGSY